MLRAWLFHALEGMTVNTPRTCRLRRRADGSRDANRSGRIMTYLTPTRLRSCRRSPSAAAGKLLASILGDAPRPSSLISPRDVGHVTDLFLFVKVKFH